MKGTEYRLASAQQQDGEQGFMLLGLIVAIAIIMLWLGVAASETAFSLRREREVESARRADQYVRAIRKFYIKNGNHYPGSIEQLEKTNNIRFLRQKYVDPLTGKADYRLIMVGQNKTTVKGFFGQPLAGIASTGLGSAAGMQSSGVPGPTVAGANGATGTSGASGTGSSGTGSSGSTGGFGGSGTAGAGGTTGSAGSSDTFNGTQMATGLPGTTGPFMGVGSSATGNSILVVNEQTTYETWEFLYDPRIEKLKAAAALNAGASSAGAGSLGTTNGFGPSSGSTPTSPGGASGGTPPQP